MGVIILYKIFIVLFKRNVLYCLKYFKHLFPDSKLLNDTNCFEEIKPKKKCTIFLIKYLAVFSK